MIISFLNQKGGVGKTTLSVNVAGIPGNTGAKVLLVDADKQGSATTWASLREETPFQVVSMARENLAKDVLKLAQDFDATVIDGPPHAEGIARACVIASDFVALPIEPSGLSTWASDLTVRQVREAQAFKETLKCGFVVSRKIGNTVIRREIRTMAAEAGIPLLTAEVEQRVAYAESLTMGKTIFEWLPTGAAAKEIKTLTNEIMQHVQEELRDSATAKKPLAPETIDAYVQGGAGHDTAQAAPPVSAPEKPKDVPMKRLSIDLSEDAHRRFKVACAATGRKMTNELTAFIEQRTAELEAETRK